MTLAEIIAQTAPENCTPVPRTEIGHLAERLRHKAILARGGKVITNRQANVAAKRARTLAGRQP